MMTQKQALIQALQLAITAPTDELSQECVRMAESFSVGLTDDEIQTCKLIASSSTTCQTFSVTFSHNQINSQSSNLTNKSMTNSSASVLRELTELKQTWRTQGFNLTQSQQQRYDELLELRRAFVTYWRDNDMVWVGPKVDKKDQQQEDPNAIP